MSSFTNEFETIIQTGTRSFRVFGQALTSSSFRIQVTSEDYTQRWANQFSATFIDDVTTKAGSVKKINVFWKMLANAAHEFSSSVQINILTAEDLQPDKESSVFSPENANRIYLVLVHSTEYESARYPLPLPPSPLSSDELLDLAKRLYEENTRLKQKISEINNSYSAQVLEQKINELNKNLKSVRKQKDDEIQKLESKLRRLRAQTPTKTPESMNSRLYDVKPRTPQMLHKLTPQSSAKKSPSKRTAQKTPSPKRKQSSPSRTTPK